MKNFKVLVLCQRKCSDIDKKVENTVVNIKKFLKEKFGKENNFTYTFLTDGMVGDRNPRCIDVIMKFDMYTQKTLQWVKNNENLYDIIIMNTCPFVFLSQEFWYGIWRLLSKKGKIFMTAFSDKRMLNISLDLTIGGSSGIVRLKPNILEMIYLLFDIDKKNKMMVRKDVNMDDVFSKLLDCTYESNNLEKVFFILPYNLQKFTLDISSFINKNKIKYKVSNIELAKKLLLKYN